MAGNLLEQGYNMGLFRIGTAALGTEEITTHMIWNSMSNKDSITRIMRGYIGLRYSPFVSMSATSQGQTFIRKFNALNSTRWNDLDGTVRCFENTLDDSGDFYLYSTHLRGKVVCGGLDFSHIYPFAAQVYDAVYAAAYALHDQLVVHNKTHLTTSSFYNAIIKQSNFNGASGIIKFTSGNTFYPHDNRGNREDGHEYLIINFDAALYLSSFNGSSGLGYSGVISPVSGIVLDKNEFMNLLTREQTYVKLTFNTKDGNPPVIPDVYAVMDSRIVAACHALFAACIFVIIVYSILSFLFRSMKVLNRDEKQMFFFILFGGFLFALRVLLTGLHTTDQICVLKFWFEHVAFFMLYGGIFCHALGDVFFAYHNKILKRGTKNFIDRFKRREKIYHSIQEETQECDQDSENWFVNSAFNRRMMGALFFALTYLGIIMAISAPHRDYLVVHMNLETKYHIICSMREPVMETVLYSFEILLMSVGLVVCILLRLQMSYLVETRGNPMVLIVPMVLITVVFIMVIVMVLYSSISEESKQFLIAACGVSTATISILIICTSTLYLILSLKFDGLVIHEVLLSNCTIETLNETILRNTNCIYGVDRYGQNAFQLALEYDIHEDLLLELIRYFLPYDTETTEAIPAEHHGYVWMYLIQQDINKRLVEKIIKKYSVICLELANAVDSEGRVAVNIASNACQKMLKESTYFCRRYEITTMDAPVHVSLTCIVHFAVDHKNNCEKIALKLMKNMDQYSREVLIRRNGQLNNDFVVEILQTFDAFNDLEYLEAIKIHDFMNFPYCIVMPAADRELNCIITNEHIAGKDWGQIKYICIEVAKALQLIHLNGFIHD